MCEVVFRRRDSSNLARIDANCRHVKIRTMTKFTQPNNNLLSARIENCSIDQFRQTIHQKHSARCIRTATKFVRLVAFVPGTRSLHHSR